MSKKLCHRKILQTLRKHFCQLKTFSDFQKKFRLKSDEKKISKVELCYTESFWHVESSFDSFAWNFSQTFCNIFAPNAKTIEKLYTLRKNFHSIKFLYRNLEFCFDHPVEIYTSKGQSYIHYFLKINRRPMFSEKKSSKSSWRVIESSVVNGALFLRTKNQKLLFKVPKVF